MIARFALVLLGGLAWAGPFDAVERLLSEKCVKCHGGQQTLSDLDLTRRAGLVKGGKHGPAISAGDPSQSRLYQWTAEGRMPPGQKLSAAEVDAIATWIRAGAPWGERESIAVRKTWWAFEPPVKRQPPAMEGVAHPIDAFLLAKLKEKGLGFNPKADHRTLVRRLSFATTGLPPAREDFGLGYEELLNRLLASKHYGERWGRHWLDVVRYGETDGGEHNIERKNAWPYRDWVIESLNADKPYNQFVREQLAGDLLAPDDARTVAATGFLTAGPWDSVSAVLNKDETLKQQARMDELDDMVTTTAHSFLALTVNCARCHDHKFDPIPTRDYYRMTAFFSGIGFGEREIATEELRRRRDEFLKPLHEQMESVRRGWPTSKTPSARGCWWPAMRRWTRNWKRPRGGFLSTRSSTGTASRK